jgi:hypothetical protein
MNLLDVCVMNLLLNGGLMVDCQCLYCLFMMLIKWVVGHPMGTYYQHGW